MKKFDEAVQMAVDRGKAWTKNEPLMAACRVLYDAVIDAGRGQSTDLVEGRGPRMTQMEKVVANSAAVQEAKAAVADADPPFIRPQNYLHPTADFIQRKALRELRKAARAS